MAHGDPSKSKTTEVFNKRIDELEEIAQKQSQSFRNSAKSRPANIPSGLKTANLGDVPTLHEPAWNRNEINQIYAELVADVGKKGGTVGGLVQMKMQCDFLAVEERAFRLRHASMIRAACVSHGRLDGHSQKQASVFSQLRNTVNNVKLISAMHAQQNDSTTNT